jgi:hypothetical protein
MRSDSKALLKVFAWSGVVALAVMAVLGTAVVGWLKPEIAAVLALGCFLVGVVIVGTRFRGALTSVRPRPDEPDRPPKSDRPVS